MNPDAAMGRAIFWVCIVVTIWLIGMCSGTSHYVPLKYRVGATVCFMAEPAVVIQSGHSQVLIQNKYGELHVDVERVEECK